jgi:hypothetical protein
MKVEAELQKMLEESPSLIKIEDIREGSSPLVVSIPEFALADSGLIDILAFSSKGDVAIIECKLDKNQEARRKVIGQVLEYASFLWQTSYEEIDEQIQRKKGKPLAELVRESVKGEWDEEEFRQGVRDSLQNGEFLLMVVVDGMNEQLRHIVRYVNECGKSAFSLHALEMKVFKAEGVEIIVPQLHGEAAKPSTARGAREWTEDLFFEELEKRNPEAVIVAKDLYKWIVENADHSQLGKGPHLGTFTFSYLGDDARHSVFCIRTDGRLVMTYEYLVRTTSREVIEALNSRLREIRPLKGFSSESTGPSVKIEAFADGDYLEKFKQTILWLRSQLGA